MTKVKLLSQEDSLEKELQPTPVFFFEEFHGQRSTVYGVTESDMTEHVRIHDNNINYILGEMVVC